MRFASVASGTIECTKERQTASRGWLYQSFGWKTGSIDQARLLLISHSSFSFSSIPMQCSSSCTLVESTFTFHYSFFFTSSCFHLLIPSFAFEAAIEQSQRSEIPISIPLQLRRAVSSPTVTLQVNGSLSSCPHRNDCTFAATSLPTRSLGRGWPRQTRASMTYCCLKWYYIVFEVFGWNRSNVKNGRKRACIECEWMTLSFAA